MKPDLRNKEIMEKRFPDALNKCRIKDVGGCLDTAWAQDNSIIFSLSRGRDEKVFFHSPVNPRQQAADLLRAQDFHAATAVFVFGFGFGYYLEEVRRRFDGLVFVIEPSCQILKSAIEQVDLSGLLQDEKLFLLTEEKAIAACLCLYTSLQKSGLGRLLFLMHPGYEYFMEYFADLKKTFSQDTGFKLSLEAERLVSGLIRTYAAEFRASSYSDLSAFNHVRFVSSFFSRQEESIRMLFDNAFYLFEQKRYAESLEAFNVAWAEDSIKLNNSFFRDTELVRKVADCYELIAGLSRPDSIPEARPPRAKKGERLAVAHITSNFVDDTHSPTRLLRTFAKYHDRARFSLHIYSSELGAARQNRNYFVGITTPPSSQRAPRFLEYLKGEGIDCYLTPASGTHLDSAAALYRQIKEDNIDILFFHSSMFSTVDFLVSSWRPSAVQVNVNIGAFMLSRSLDAVTYFVPSTMEAEKKIWIDAGIQAQLMPQGADFSDRMEKALPVKKEELGIRESTVVFVTVGNHLDTRISEQFLGIVAEALARHDCAWLIVGDGDFSNQNAFLKERGLADKVKFLGAQRDVFCFYKIADIYLNEFPLGGGMSVLEAMSCGLAVVALHAGPGHLENCGANYVGQQHFVRDAAGYAQLLNRLIDDQALRKETGLHMRRRYENEFSASGMVRAFEDFAVALYEGKNERKRE